MAPTEPIPGAPPMTAPPPARTLDFGASATASLLVKMAITYGISEQRDPMITFSLFEKTHEGRNGDMDYYGVGFERYAHLWGRCDIM